MVEEIGNDLTLIENMNIQMISSKMENIVQFQKIVQTSLHQNTDYGIIPNTSKPTLFKAGAEKILMLMGLTSQYNIIESVRDYEEGFFAFSIEAKIYHKDKLITEGLGHCNTRERKYVKLNSYDLANTVLKMAKKRAMVDATLTVASLSDLFTQDLEDIDIQGNAPSQNKKVYTDRSGVISEAQAKRMYAISDGNAKLCKQVLKEFGYSSSKEVLKTDYNDIVDRVREEEKKLKKEKENKKGGSTQQTESESWEDELENDDFDDYMRQTQEEEQSQS